MQNDINLVATRLRKEEIILYDAAGNPIPMSSNLWSSASEEYYQKAQRIFEEVLQGVPISTLQSEPVLRETLTKAFQSGPKSKYSFDVSTGKLKLTLPTPKGEITGNINIYSIVKSIKDIAITGSSGYGVTRLIHDLKGKQVSPGSSDKPTKSDSSNSSE